MLTRSGRSLTKLSVVCFVLRIKVSLVLGLVQDLSLEQGPFVFERRVDESINRGMISMQQNYPMRALTILLVSLTHELPVKSLQKGKISDVLALAR